MAEKSQKFHMGDIVRVKNNAPLYKTGRGEEAQVVGSYKDLFGYGYSGTYTLFFKSRGRIAWYDEKILTLVRKAPSW